MLQNAVFCDDIQKKPSASGGVAPRPLPGALPLDPTGGLLRPPDPRIIFLLFHFSPVPCLMYGASVKLLSAWMVPQWNCLYMYGTSVKLLSAWMVPLKLVHGWCHSEITLYMDGGSSLKLLGTYMDGASVKLLSTYLDGASVNLLSTLHTWMVPQ